MIDTLTQGHFLPVVAPATILTGIGRVDLHQVGASFRRFAFQLREKGRPGRVTERFRKAMVMQHAIDDQILINGDTLSPEQELVQDLIAITTVFSARLHGLRSYKKVIKDAALHKDQV